MPAPRTTSLFHFTKTLDVLKSILKNGFFPFYSLEDIRWLGAPPHEFAAFPLVAFCDIPLSRITDHVGFYGKYGIGLSREWGLSNGLNPLVYLGESGPFTEVFRNTMKNLYNETKGDQDKDYLGDIRFLIGSAKALTGTMIVNGAPVDKEFYQEAEWRYLARHDDVPIRLRRADYEDDAVLQDANQKARTNCTLKFSPNDVQYLFVPQDSEIPDLVDFINKELDQYPMVDIKILSTRIVTLAAVEADI